jgi:Family of unknown function (DUF6152)
VFAFTWSFSGRLKPAATVALILTLAAARADAHHSFAADFDVTKPVTLTGRVTKIEWLNPHVHIYIDVNGQPARFVSWTIELGSPNGLRQRGWTPKTLKIGDVITIDGSLAKDGSHLANASSIVLPSGVRMSTGSGQGKTS